MSREKELAYRYDLFVAPDWRDRFDKLIEENVKLPAEGKFLEVNCGTGAFAILTAERLKDKGDVVAIDPDSERISLATAKALVAKVQGVTFQTGATLPLPYRSNEFDAVIGDASMLRESHVEPFLKEIVRVARTGAPVVLKLATHGSFDEFFSIYWEALHECGLDEEAWEGLKSLIEERGTVSEAEEMAERAGLEDVEVISKKEEFYYESANEFLTSPLIEDSFLSDWIGIIPEPNREKIRGCLEATIDRERVEAPFEISIKATVASGIKKSEADSTLTH